jgi:hypothetical protein
VSIESFRKFIEKYGKYIFGLMFLAFTISFVSTGQTCSATNAASPRDSEPAVVTIGDFKATAFEINKVANMRAQGAQSFGPAQVADAFASATQGVVDSTYRLAFAADKGIKLDDGAVEESIPSIWAQQVQTFKEILTREGKLKPTSTQAEFEAAFKAYDMQQQKPPGRTLEEQRLIHTEQFKQQFSDTSVRELMRSEVADHELKIKYAMQYGLSDTQVQNAFGSYKVLQLNVVQKAGVNDPKSVADKALADIKGGMKFEDAITKYSNEVPVQAGKKPTDPVDIQSFQLQYLATYRPLLSMNAGDVSNVVEMGPGMYTIFKVLKFTPNVPPDFANQKDQARKMMVSTATDSAIRTDLEAFKKAKPAVWKSPAFKAMYDYTLAQAEMSDKRTAALKKIQAESKQAVESDKDNGNVAALAYFAVTKSLYETGSAAEKKALVADRIDSTEKVLSTTESPDDRLILVDLYLDAGRTDEAVGQLELAARANTGTNADAVENYEKILARYDKLSAQNKVPENQKKNIEQATSEWRSQIVQEQQLKAQAIKEQEKLERENAAAMAKQKAKDDADKKAAAERARADAKKAKTAAKPATPTPAKPK